MLFFIVIPTSFTAYKAQPINGSSATALCSNFSETDSLNSFQCNTPDSSVLFDGKLPQDIRFMSDPSWARQLFTAQQRTKYEMHFDFTGQHDYAGVGMVELVIFNFPDWGISLQAIADEEGITYTGIQYDHNDRMAVLCFPLQASNSRFSIEFKYMQWIHLAEIVFYTGNQCLCRTDHSSGTLFEGEISDKCEEKVIAAT